jgi:putative phage-type endonuclease
MSIEPLNHVIDSAPAIVHSPREQWLLAGREKITASDVAAVLGMDPRRRPGDVFAAKLGLAQETESWPMRWGTAIQGAIGEAYAQATGRNVRVVPNDLPELTVHPEIPWLAASLDGDVDGSEQMPAPATGQGVFEAKASSIAHTWGDEVPETFLIQVTVQAACARRAWGSVGAFVSLREPPRVQDILFDKELFDLLVPRLEAFLDCVRRKEPPLDNVDWWSTEAIRKVWSKNNGETVVFDEEGAELVRQWREAKAREKAAEAAVEVLGNRIRLLLEGSALGLLPAGFGGGGVALSDVRETFVAAHRKAAHTRLLDKQPKGGK